MRISKQNVSEILTQPLGFPSFKVQNIAIVNLCNEFAYLYNRIREPEHLLGVEYYDKLTEEERGRISFASREAFVNFHVSSIIVRFEAYLRFALWECDNVCSIGITKLVRSPLRAAKPLSKALYDVLPSKVLPDFSLRVSNPEVFSFLEEFYRDVRNSLFHGSELEKPSAYEFLQFMEVYARLYEWIASWACVMITVTRGKEGRLQVAADFDLNSYQPRWRTLLERRKAAGLN